MSLLPQSKQAFNLTMSGDIPSYSFQVKAGHA